MYECTDLNVGSINLSRRVDAKGSKVTTFFHRAVGFDGQVKVKLLVAKSTNTGILSKLAGLPNHTDLQSHYAVY